MRSRGTPETERGFTLLELLVVITVLGLLMVALTNGVRFAGRAWELQQQHSQREGDLDAVHNMLRQLIASGYAFKAIAKEVKFVAPLPAALNRGGLYDVSLNAPFGDLILTWTPHFRGQSRQASADRDCPLPVASANSRLGYYALRVAGEARFRIRLRRR